MIPRDTLSRDAVQILGCADLYARKHGPRVVFFSDLTRMFTAAGTSWAQLGVDWESALQELAGRPVPPTVPDDLRARPPLHLQPRERTSSSPGRMAHRKRPKPERELVRQAIASKLDADWPPYMQQIINAGHIRLAG